jgi:hypothetical protein
MFANSFHMFIMLAIAITSISIASASCTNDTSTLQGCAARIDNLTVVEGVTAQTMFSIGGAHGRLDRDLWMVVVELVSLPTYGALFLAKYNGRPALINGVVDDFFVDDGFVHLHYKAYNDTYFNTPSTTSKGETIPGIRQESFTYQVRTIDRQTKVVVNTSALIVQPIHVLNMNHKPTLSVPKVATSIEDQSTFGSTRKFIVNNILLEDTDKNVDKVRVSVWAKNGSLSLNQDFLRLADFDDCSSRSMYSNVSKWRCTGRGRSDRNMTFVAQPDDVNKLLNGMVYSPYFGNNEDYISIQIFDGQDGDCLVNDEHTKFGNSISSARKGCFTVRGQVYVPASEQVIESEEESDPNFIENTFAWFGVDKDVNLLTVMWWMIIIFGSLALYENLLQCLGSCFSVCLSKKCLSYFSIMKWISWLLCCCGQFRPKELLDDWPEDEQISAVHIYDGYLYERSKNRKPEQWRKTAILHPYSPA